MICDNTYAKIYWRIEDSDYDDYDFYPIASQICPEYGISIDQYMDELVRRDNIGIAIPPRPQEVGYRWSYGITPSMDNTLRIRYYTNSEVVE